MGRPVKKTILNEVYMYVHGDGSHRLITKQKGSRRYEVATHGTSVYKLVASSSPAAGEGYILARDSDLNVYYVTKLTRHKATVVRKEQVGVPLYQFADPSVYPNGQSVEWHPFSSAVTGVSVIVENSD